MKGLWPEHEWRGVVRANRRTPEAGYNLRLLDLGQCLHELDQLRRELAQRDQLVRVLTVTLDRERRESRDCDEEP